MVSRFLFFLLVSGALLAQPTQCPTPYDGSPCVKTYPTAPTIKTFASGTLECTIWSQTVAPASVQVACCNTTCAGKYNGPLVLNHVYDISIGSAFGGIMMPGGGVVSWIFSPQSAGKVAFDVAVMAYPTGAAQELAGVF